MKRNQLIGLVLMPLLAALGPGSSATVVDLGTLGYQATRSDRVAVVNIVDRRVAEIEIEGEQYECGWLMVAEVKENLKGGIGQFEFFTTTHFGFFGFERSYLVMTYARAQPEQAYLSSLGKEPKDASPKEVCIDRHQRLNEWIHWVPNSIFPFDPAAEAAFGGQWIFHVSALGHGFSYDPDFPVRFEEVPVGPTSTFDQPCEVENWLDVKVEIMSWLNRT